jgi:serine protease Do
MPIPRHAFCIIAPARRVGIPKPAVELTRQRCPENKSAVMLRCLVFLADLPPGWPAGLVTAQSWMPPQSLARPPEPASIHSEKTGTGFFIVDPGNMLTARHAAAGRTPIVVVKEGRAVAARVMALAPSVDLALIKVPETMGLAAVFPNNVTATVKHGVCGSLRCVAPMAARGSTLANATVTRSDSDSEAGYLAIDSNVTFGAVGAPALDSRGLTEG